MSTTITRNAFKANAAKIEALAAPAAYSFDELKALYTEARAAEEQYERETLAPVADAFEAECARRGLPLKGAFLPIRHAVQAEQFPELDRLEETDQALLEEWIGLQTLAIFTPAPDAAALLWKLEALFGDDCANPKATFAPAIDIERLRAVMADARRILPA